MEEELVDLVDEHGVIQVVGIPRSEVKARKEEFLKQGLYLQIVVVVVLNKDNHVIAHVRGPEKAGDGAGEFDHVCGAIRSGKSWLSTSLREAKEEVGVRLIRLNLLKRGINAYQRYEYLVCAHTTDTPSISNPGEVAEIVTASLEGFREMEREGSLFAKGFFEDVQLALSGGET